MRRYILPLFLLFSFCFVTAQTIVKMNVPTQAKEPVNVVVLFDEQVPEGMPVVLGLMGYNVTGGIEPYTYEWVQNGNVIGSGDVVVITPKKGDQFTLKATDKNKCHNTTSFNMKVISRANGQTENENGCRIYPTIISDDKIYIDLPVAYKMIDANVRIFDVNGNLMFQTITTASFTITEKLAAGAYFVSVKTEAFHKVSKIIVQH
ncbi:MAG: T9SS type A sorting domain-containing protein [Paludibacter sp.]